MGGKHEQKPHSVESSKSHKSAHHTSHKAHGTTSKADGSKAGLANDGTSKTPIQDSTEAGENHHGKDDPEGGEIVSREVVTDQKSKPESAEAPSERSGGTVVAFKKEQIPDAPSSHTVISTKTKQPAPVLTMEQRNKAFGPLKPKKFDMSLTKIHEKWTKMERDSKFQLNTLYPRSVEPGAMEEFKGVQATRQYSYEIKVGQEEHARLPPDRPGMAQSDEDNLKLLPEVTEREARKHLTERVNKRKLKQTKLKKKAVPKAKSRSKEPVRRHHHHHRHRVPVELPDLPETPPKTETPPPPSEAPLPTPPPSLPLPVVKPSPPPEDPQAAGDVKKKKKKKKQKRRRKKSSSSSSSSTSISRPPCCFQAYNVEAQNNVCGNPCREDSSASSDEGLDFQFRPAHPDCATEVTLTIEPDEQDILEYALDNGIRPVICCTMPPCLMVTPNIWQQPQCYQQWGQQGQGNNGCGQPEKKQEYNAWGQPQNGAYNNWGAQKPFTGWMSQAGNYNAGWSGLNGSACNQQQNGNKTSSQQNMGNQQQMNFGWPQQTATSAVPSKMGSNQSIKTLSNQSIRQMGSGQRLPQTGFSGTSQMPTGASAAQQQKMNVQVQPPQPKVNTSNERRVVINSPVTPQSRAPQVQSQQAPDPGKKFTPARMATDIGVGKGRQLYE